MDNERNYNPEEYWSSVGGRIVNRTSNRAVAGDTDPLSVYIRKKFLKKFLSLLSVRNRDCLEIGCGPGGNLAALSVRDPKRLTGVDISQTMVDLARESNASNDAEIYKTDGQTLPFLDGEFDMVFSVTVIQHNYDEMAIRLLSEICRVSKESVILFEDVGTRRNEVYSYVVRTVSDYTDLLGKHGFSFVGVEYLATGCSERAVAWFRRVFRQRERIEEGVSNFGPAQLIEMLIVLLSSVVDDFIPSNDGLAKMVFKKRS
jgi:SAM-dependent methyltransferase